VIPRVPGSLSDAHVQISPAVERAHDALLAHPDLQFDFPAYQPPVTPQWLVELAKFLQRIWPSAQVMGYIGWAIIIVGGLIIVYLILATVARRGWPRWSRKIQPATSPEWRPAPQAARDLLREADRLAALGKFAQAVHLLLLRSIEHIGEQIPNLVKPAMTSREIGALRQLPAAARNAFVAMARIVERALFAGLALSASDFRECRETYERFAFPALWAAGER
jgi:hypothetical protein